MVEGKASEAIIVAINRRVHRGESNGTENQSVLATIVSRKRSMKKDGMIALAFQRTRQTQKQEGLAGWQVVGRELQGRKTGNRKGGKKAKKGRKGRGREWSRKSVGIGGIDLFFPPSLLLQRRSPSPRFYSISVSLPSPPLPLLPPCLFFCVCIVRIIPVLASFTWL